MSSTRAMPPKTASSQRLDLGGIEQGSKILDVTHEGSSFGQFGTMLIAAVTKALAPGRIIADPIGWIRHQ